jgi:hypothetical protein
MATPLLNRQTQFLAEIEAAPGTAETLVAADGGIRLVDGSAFENQIELEDRNLVTSSLSNVGSLVSTKAGAMTIISELNTSDTITSALEYADTLKACALDVIAASKITIGAVTGSGYVSGETVTGGTSSATAIVAAPTVDGDTTLYIYSITGTLQSGEVLTGGTSGSTATTSSTASSHGFVAVPISDSQITNTIELQKDGYAWSLIGAMANMEIAAENAKRGLITFGYTGVKGTWGDKAFTSGITYNSENPPKFENARVKIGSYSPVLTSFTFNLNNEVVLRPDANAAANGFIAAYIPKRKPTISITTEFALAANYDYFAKLIGEDLIAVQLRVGSVAGKQIWLSANKAQITGLSVGDNDGIVSLDVEMELTGVNNNEFTILFA